MLLILSTIHPMSIISWFYVWSCLKIHLLRLRHLLLPVLLKAHWPFVLDAQLTHQTLPLTCDCQTRLTRQHHRGPGLRGSNPAKIDHFLLFCELQTCEAISSDGVCSLYLKMGWLCSEGPSEQSHVSEKVQTGMSSE
jgi:hypothetical protein